MKAKPNPFVTPEIMQLMKTRDNWYMSAMKTNDKLHWNAYKFFGRKLNGKSALPSNKAPGFSKIPARILKDSFPEFIRKTVTVASCINKLIQINRIKHLFDKETLSLIFNSFVSSRLFDYSSVWSNTSVINIHKLQLVPAKFCSQDYLRASQI